MLECWIAKPVSLKSSSYLLDFKSMECWNVELWNQFHWNQFHTYWISSPWNVACWIVKQFHWNRFHTYIYWIKPLCTTQKGLHLGKHVWNPHFGKYSPRSPRSTFAKSFGNITSTSRTFFSCPLRSDHPEFFCQSGYICWIMLKHVFSYSSTPPSLKCFQMISIEHVQHTRLPKSSKTSKTCNRHQSAQDWNVSLWNAFSCILFHFLQKVFLQCRCYQGWFQYPSSWTPQVQWGKNMGSCFHFFKPSKKTSI